MKQGPHFSLRGGEGKARQAAYEKLNKKIQNLVKNVLEIVRAVKDGGLGLDLMSR